MNTNKNSKVKKRIKLSNNSKVAATFMFNIDEKNRIFHLDTRYGIINAYSRKYVTITFIPPKEGRYTYYLIILILYQVNKKNSIKIYNIQQRILLFIYL